MSNPNPYPKRRRAPFAITLIFAGIVVVLWVGWPIIREQMLAIAAPDTTATETATLTLTPTLTGTPEVDPLLPVEVTVAVQHTPEPLLSPGDSPGLIVLSMSDGPYTHLFAFHPQSLPLTRLTDHPWDDIDPAISPDGTRIAYSSRRNGYWDIYILDLRTAELIRITDTPEYEGSPCWSPDGQWLAYETYAMGNLDIWIQSIEDLSQPPIILTDSPSADFSPAWSPLGREIAFVSNRSGIDEIWTAQLDRIEGRFANVSQGIGSPAEFPAWSPDGTHLAWAGIHQGARTLYFLDTQRPDQPPLQRFAGDRVVWSPDGESLLLRQRSLNQVTLSVLNAFSGQLALPFTQLPGEIHGFDWKAGQIVDLLPGYYLQSPAEPVQLWQPILSHPPTSPPGRYGIVEIPDVDVSVPYLHDAVDESFNALRKEIARQSGWDLLGNLEYAFLPITETPNPGTVDEWLLTGRAFAINPLPVKAGWLAIVREDQAGQTYWRIFVLARYQDGSQGRPMRVRTWDLDARNSGDPRLYEQGGDYRGIPSGYWIDFTELASRFGWQPVPALLNWRTYYPAARFNQLVLSDGLDWNSAMSQFYPPEALSVPTALPTLTLTPSLTPTIRYYRSVTPQPSPTATLAPTYRPTWTPLPGNPYP